MPQVINTNFSSLNTQRALNRTSSALETTLARLSSGFRINTAKDDAAGLAISERLTSQIRGLNQAARNANDAISLAQTAEGGLVEITNNLQRIRELAVQAANGTKSSSDRAALQTEVSQRLAEITRIADQTQFNNINLLDGSFASTSFQVGANAGQQISLQSVADFDATGLSVNAVSVATAAGAGSAITAIDTALTTVNTQRATFGAIQNRFESTIANTQNAAENLSAARSRIRDTDFAAETAELTRAQILQQAGISVLAQANANPQSVLALLQ